MRGQAVEVSPVAGVHHEDGECVRRDVAGISRPDPAVDVTRDRQQVVQFGQEAACPRPGGDDDAVGLVGSVRRPDSNTSTSLRHRVDPDVPSDRRARRLRRLDKRRQAPLRVEHATISLEHREVVRVEVPRREPLAHLGTG